MARHWSPRRIVECTKCQWWGPRVLSTTRKACPSCGAGWSQNVVAEADLSEAQRKVLEKANRR